MASVVLQNVEKTYPGNVRAVSDFNLSVRDGEFVVLVGPSGCGKSTVLRMIAGLEEITGGTISIGDRVVNDVPPKNRDIAMVFQNYALYPHMTVRDNMAFGLKLRKLPKQEIETRINAAADILNLKDLLDRRPKALSGGQRQRVAVGRAIVRQPAVFLFDEPLSNLDAKLRVRMRVELSQLHNRLGTTMIYVTHDQVEAMTMGERIVVMKDGLIQQIADPISLYDSPANLFVAGFIGTPPMNLIEGRIVASGAGLIFTSPDGGIKMPVPRPCEQALAARGDRPTTLGLRPEHIGSGLAEQTPGMPRFDAVVDVVEPIGSESFVYLKTGSTTLVSRVDAHRKFSVGQKVSPAVLTDKAHFFDSETGKAVSCP